MPQINYKILVVDDDTQFHQNLRNSSLKQRFEFESARNTDEMNKKLSDEPGFHLILLDLDLHNNEDITVGLDLIPDLCRRFPEIPITVVTRDGKPSTVVDAMRRGARDYLQKSALQSYELWGEQFRKTIEALSETTKLKRVVNTYKEKTSQEYPFIGESDPIQEIKRTLRIVSEDTDMTVLLTGETGVGKEVAARYLHNQGMRSNAPFVGVNLSAIDKNMLESELFGHKKGSFTNAEYDREGYFRQADTGILMLDEIGDINTDIQIKLLRFLETRLIRPIGWDKDVQLDVQIVTATHRNLQKEVQAGNFREDLYQRLKAMVIEIPALRSRKDDIPLIIRHYLRQQGQEEGLIPNAVMKILMDYVWPGNIRELVNTVRSMMMRRKILGRNIIDPECLPKEIQEFIPGTSFQSQGDNSPQLFDIKMDDRPVDEQKAIVELTRIEAAFKKHSGSGAKKQVASELEYDKEGKSDNLNYRITSFYKQFPHLFSAFPVISSAYKKYIH